MTRQAVGVVGPSLAESSSMKLGGLLAMTRQAVGVVGPNPAESFSMKSLRRLLVMTRRDIVGVD